MKVFEVNGVVIKNPSSFKVERFNVTNMARNAAGYMVGDLLAKKLKFYFTYEAIDSTDLDTILDAVWDSSGLFFPLKYTMDGVTKSATVYVGSIPTELHRMGMNGHTVWKNVTFNLIER